MLELWGDRRHDQIRLFGETRTPILPAVTDYDADAFDAYELAGWEAIAGRFDELLEPGHEPGDRRAARRGARRARARASSTWAPVPATQRDTPSSVARRRRASTSRPRWSRSRLGGTRRRPSSRQRRPSFRSPTAPSTRSSATTSSSTSASRSEPPASWNGSWLQEVASHCRAGMHRSARPSSLPCSGAVATAEVPSPSEAPAGPSFFQFTDDAVFRALLEDAGFEAVAVDAVAVEIPVASADELDHGVGRGNRSRRRGASCRRRPCSATGCGTSLEERLSGWRRGAGFAVPAPMKLASGTKPA